MTTYLTSRSTCPRILVESGLVNGYQVGSSSTGCVAPGPAKIEGKIGRVVEASGGLAGLGSRNSTSSNGQALSVTTSGSV